MGAELGIIVPKYGLGGLRDMSNVVRVSEAASLGLHTMVYLAGQGDRRATAHDIAELLGVSEAHLAKVLQRLSRVGLVDSTRGLRGGSRLARPGDEISLLEVYETIEGPLTDTTCLLNEKVCRGDQCILGGLLETVNRQARDYLAGRTLADLSDVFGGTRDEDDPEDS